MNKILFLSGSYNQCGGIYSMLTLMNDLKLKGYSVDLVIGNHGTAESIEHEFNIQSQYIKSYNWIVPLGQWGGWKLLAWIKEQVKKIINIWSEAKIYCYIKSYKPDIVVMNSSDQYVGIKACNRLGIPVIMHFREFMTYDHRKKYWSENMARKYFSKLDGGIAISKDIQQYFSQYPIKNLKVIYNGVDLKKYEATNEKPHDSVFNISCVGKVCQGKNQQLALKAAKLLVENGHDNFHMYFYGNDQNDYARSLKKYVRQQGLNDYITFEGMVDDVEIMYGKAHLNLLCSKREAFGRAVIEGMLNHCLNVVPNNGGVSEIIEDHGNGLLFNTDNDQALYQVLDYAMSNYEKLEGIIEQGYQDAKGKYSSEINAKNIEDYLKAICNIHRKSAGADNK